MQKIKSATLKKMRSFLSKFNIGIARYDQMEEYRKNPRARKDLKLLSQFSGFDIARLILLLDKSKSQLRQDLVVLSYHKFKTHGFFVEFGASDGIKLSNTFLLESEFSWSGILAEPAKIWHQQLRTNRKCSIDFRCVWRESEKFIRFIERDFTECSGIQEVRNKKFSINSFFDKTYDVETISLNDLLEHYNSPKIIDYLSLDTEGSEFDILETVNFEEYSFRFISCEHNFTRNREKIFRLLTSKGYSRILENYSEFDDWYVNNRDLTPNLVRV